MENRKDMIYIKKILQFFLENKTTTSYELAKHIGLSEKTMRSKIDLVHDYLVHNNLGRINRKPRVGYWLETERSYQEINSYLHNITENEKTVFGNIDSTYMLIKILLKNDQNGVSMEKIADTIYVSLPTAHKERKIVEKWFENYNINMESVRNTGIVLQYKEISYRIALKDFILNEPHGMNVDDLISYYFPGLDIQGVKDIILDVENEWNLKMGDKLFNELLIYLCILIIRADQSKGQIAFDQEEKRVLQKYNEYSFGNSICTKVSMKFGVNPNEEECFFITKQILAGSIILDHPEETARSYDDKLQNFVHEIISTVGNILNIDFSEDELLEEGLLQHVRPLIFRARYGKVTDGSLINMIKKEYKHVYRAVWSISVLIEEYYDIQISEDELGYIVLYFQAAIERNQHPLKIVMVSTLATAHNHLIIEKIRKIFRSINELVLIPKHQYKQEDYKEFDIILDAAGIEIDDSRAISVSIFTIDQCINNINARMTRLKLESTDTNEKFDVKCHQLFDPELIHLGLEFKQKEDVIRHLCSALVQKGYATDSYVNTVLERENATLTSIGNGVAIPHGNQNLINEAKVVIGILNTPITWNDEDQVDVVFLLAVKMNSEEEIEKTKLFYKQYISLVETDEKIQKLKNMNSNIDLYKYLIR
ncbi:MAG TPA: hypothetical protein DHM90_04170 [Clostridiaceae bacterium]|nr:hypothetical protein [Clostridiaceae bacterium]